MCRWKDWFFIGFFFFKGGEYIKKVDGGGLDLDFIIDVY